MFLAPPTLNTLPDAVLVARAQAGCSDSWAELWCRHQSRITSYLRYRLGGRPNAGSVAEDLAADVFLKAWEKLDTYRTRGVPFSAWLFRIAHNVFVDLLRRQPKQAPVSLSGAWGAAAGDTALSVRSVVGDALDDPQAALALDQAEARLWLRQALAALPAMQRQAVTLRWLADLSIEETAKRMGKDPDAIKQLQVRAFRRMRKALGSYQEVMAS